MRKICKEAFAEAKGTQFNHGNLSWISADQIYLARVTPSPETINDIEAYEFFAGHDDKGNPIWISDFEKIKPLLEWNNHMGCVTATWVPGLKKYLMCVTDGWPTVTKMTSYILEADALTQMNETIDLLIENRVVPEFIKDQYHEPGSKVVPLLVLGNKFDDESADENYHIFCELTDDNTPCLPVSALTKRNIDKMKQKIFETLGIIRVYSKSPMKEPDLSAPFVEEFALQLHRDFYDNLKSAKVWGSSDFDGQMVSREYVLHDEDIVELKI